MSNELGVIFSVLGAIGTLSAVIFAIINFTGSKSKAVRDEMSSQQSIATSIAVITTKLDLTLNGINDVKKELSMHINDLQQHKEKMAGEIGAMKKEIAIIKNEQDRHKQMLERKSKGMHKDED